MLVSTVIKLRPLADGLLPQSVGKALQGLFYDWLAAVDSSAATELHDSDQSKPYTVSNILLPDHSAANTLAALPDDEPGESVPLSSARPAYRPGRTDLVPVRADMVYWFRLTCYQPRLSELVLNQVLPNLPDRVQLLDVGFELQGYTTDGTEHPWAGLATYPELSQRMLDSRTTSNITLRFSSPTCFNSRGRKTLLPLPELVFGSLLNKWNDNAPLKLDEQFRRYATECLYINRYQLQTRRVNFEQIYESGFMGLCEYSTTNRDRYWLGLTATLAELAFFSGIGHRTTMGMGQTRFLS